MSGDDRSVRGRDFIGSNIVTGDDNTVTNSAKVALPTAEQVDVKAELAALRQALAALASVPNRRELNNALEDAADEAEKPEPDKSKLGGALERAVRYAQAADDFSDHVERLAPRVVALASWLGPAGHHVLAMLGLS